MMGFARLGPSHASGPIRGFEQRVQQHIAAGGEVFGFGVFDLVVADAADAPHENRRGGQARSKAPAGTSEPTIAAENPKPSSVVPGTLPFPSSPHPSSPR